MLSDIDRAVVLEKVAGVMDALKGGAKGALKGGALGGAAVGVGGLAHALRFRGGRPLVETLGTGLQNALYLAPYGVTGGGVLGAMHGGIKGAGAAGKRATLAKKLKNLKNKDIQKNLMVAGGAAAAGGGLAALLGRKKKEAGVIGRRALIGALLGAAGGSAVAANFGRSAGKASGMRSAARKTHAVVDAIEKLPPGPFRDSIIQQAASPKGQANLASFVKKEVSEGARKGLKKSRWGLGAGAGAIYGGLLGTASGIGAAKAARTKKVRKALKGAAIGAGGLAAAGGVAAALGSKK